MYIVVLSDLFADCQQKDTENDNCNECVGFPAELFLQEDPGQQQGNNAHRGEDGCGNGAIAAPIISSVCIVSLLLSRIFLKEKLSWKTYAFIAVVIVGILLLAVAEEL